MHKTGDIGTVCGDLWCSPLRYMHFVCLCTNFMSRSVAILKVVSQMPSVSLSHLLFICVLIVCTCFHLIFKKFESAIHL